MSASPAFKAYLFCGVIAWLKGVKPILVPELHLSRPFSFLFHSVYLFVGEPKNSNGQPLYQRVG